MLNRAGSRTRYALAIGLLLILGACSSTPLPDTNNAAGAPLILKEPATFVGPLVSTQESATQSLGRDGGITVPLPNGKVFWIFGDTPTYNFQNGEWKLTGFIQGSSAGLGEYTPGEPPTKPLQEIAIGSPSTAQTVATQFLPPPPVYMPDGSGKVCNKENGGPSAGAVRWAAGAALMPDKTNIFVPYISACVLTVFNHQAEGWGYAMYNWKTNKFSVPPTEVFAPKQDGSGLLTTAQYFGSPIIDGNKITMFSSTCCAAGSVVYTTTVDATTAALQNQASYYPRPVLGVPATFMLSVSKPSETQPTLMMYQLSGNKGEYRIFTATNPVGPWAEHSEGTLPKCDTSSAPCNNSIYLHPEFSTAKKIIVSYWVPGYGPADSTHPDPSNQIWHIVLSSLPN